MIIRKNVFETNSSSTSSFVIDRISNKPPLITDGVINLHNLESYVYEYVQNAFIVSNDKDVKLAFILSYYSMILKDCDEYYDENFKNKCINNIELLKKEFNIKDIKGSFYFDYSEFDILNNMKNIETLFEFIKNPDFILNYCNFEN